MVSKLARIGTALVNGDFKSAVKSVDVDTVPINPALYGSDVDDGWSFSTGGGDFSYFKYEDRNSCANAYQRCPGLNAVINKKAQAFINGTTYILDNEGSLATGSDADRLRKLLDRPNLFQSWDQFEAQMYIFVQMYGYCPMLAIKPVGYTRNIDATSLWNIPPSMIDPHFTGLLLKQVDIEKVIDKVIINYGGERSEVSIKDICLVKDLTVSTLTNTTVFSISTIVPDSRIRSLEMPINNQIGAYESRNVLINYRGALGIFSRESAASGQIPIPPATKEDKEALQKDFKRYGLRNNQWQFIITSAALKWQQVSVPTKDLMLFEEVKGSNEAICDKYNYPFELLANEKGTTFANRKDAGKDLYQNAIIPESNSIYGQLNKFFDASRYGLNIDKDYSKVAVLQEDEKERMGARYTRNQAYQIEYDNDLITRNQWRVANGDDAIEGDDLRKSEILAQRNTPLVTTIGVGGVQGIISLLTTPGMSKEVMQATLEIVFGINSVDAARMAQPIEISNPANNGAGN